MNLDLVTYQRATKLQPTTIILWLVLLLMVCPKVDILAQNQFKKGERGIPLYKTFTPRDYNAHRLNFAITQDNRGLLYFGNFAGVLEYDGINWRKIQTQNITSVSALMTSKSGDVFVGANGEFGILKPDKEGNLVFVSLSAKIKNDFGQIVNIFETKRGIFFISKKRIFIYKAKKINEIKISDEIVSSYYVNNKIIIVLKNKGLLFLEENGQKLIAQNALLEITGIFKTSNDFLILTKTQGLFKLNTKNKIEAIRCEANNYLKSNEATAGVIISDSSIAISTTKSGVMLITNNGEIINKSVVNGNLQDITANAMFQDRDGNLWMALSEGILEFDMNSSIERFVDYNNVKIEVKAIVRANERLFVAADNNLYSINNYGISKVNGIDAQYYDLASQGKALLVATNRGIYWILDKKIQKLSDAFALSILVLKNDPSIVLVGQQNGLKILKIVNGKIVSNQTVEKLNAEISGISEDKNGNIWIEASNQGLFRLNIQNNEVASFTANKGLSETSSNQITITSKGIIAYNKDGVFRYENQQDKFVPYNIFQTDSSAIANYYGKILEDSKGNIWVTNDDGKGLRLYENSKSKKSFQLLSKPFLPIADLPFEVIYPESDGIIWFGGADGVVRFDFNAYKVNNKKYNAEIRQITLNGIKTIYQGFQNDSLNLTNQKIELDYKINSILLNYAATSFHPNEVLKFQTYLENFDKSWSEWTTLSQKEYNNLAPGEYVFRVRSKNVLGTISQEASVAFTVYEPFVLRWWAFFIYLFVFVIIIYLLVRWRLRVLEKEKIELENLIRERTEEVMNQKSELEQQSEELSSKNDQLEKIDLIVQSINSKINFSNLFQTVLAQLKIIRNLESASALIFNKETSDFKFKAHFELIDNVSLSDVQLTLFQAETRYLQNAVEVYEDIYFKNDIEFDKLNNQLDKMTVPKSMVTIVIKVEQKTEGFIILENYTRINAFDLSDFNMIKNLKEHLIAAYIKTKILENLEETLTNLKVTQEELIRQERLVSVGQLTKGIVDRILNPLNYINNFSESSTILIDEVVEMFSKHEASISPEIKDDFAAMLGMIKNSVTKIYEHGNNTTRIVKDMQKLLKEKSKDFIETDLNSFVENRSKITFNEFKTKNKNVDIEIEFDWVQTNAKVSILPPELGEVITAIIDNSLYILNEKYNIDKSFTPKIVISTLVFENNVILKIRDNGKGIPQRDLQQIFSPFFTTKPTSKGTGLGMFMSKDIIELHKGKISIYSQEGIFTEVTIQLPTIINPILLS
jgi:hypothetical protein